MAQRSTYSDFVFQDRIGSGSYGQVFRAVRKVDRQTYAVKEIDLQGMSRKEQEECIRETRVLSSLDSDFIIKYYDSFLERGKLYIITEYAANGNLHDCIKRQQHRFSEQTVWKLFVQMLLGLNHMHQRKILHRDIKTLNIFLDHNFNVKLGDMGVAKILSTQTNFAKTIVGTPYYLSPELCEDKPYNEKSDVWALGVVLYEICTLKHPFDAENQGALILKILRGKFQPVTDCSPELCELVKRCLTQNAARRPNTSKLLLLPVVRQKVLELGLTMPDPDTLAAAAERTGHRPTKSTEQAPGQGAAPPAAATRQEQFNAGTPPSQHAARPPARIITGAPTAQGQGHIHVMGDMERPPSANLEASTSRPGSARPGRPAQQNEGKAFVFGGGGAEAAGQGPGQQPRPASSLGGTLKAKTLRRPVSAQKQGQPPQQGGPPGEGGPQELTRTLPRGAAAAAGQQPQQPQQPLARSLKKSLPRAPPQSQQQQAVPEQGQGQEQPALAQTVKKKAGPRAHAQAVDVRVSVSGVTATPGDLQQHGHDHEGSGASHSAAGPHGSVEADWRVATVGRAAHAEGARGSGDGSARGAQKRVSGSGAVRASPSKSGAGEGGAAAGGSSASPGRPGSAAAPPALRISGSGAGSKGDGGNSAPSPPPTPPPAAAAGQPRPSASEAQMWAQLQPGLEALAIGGGVQGGDASEGEDEEEEGANPYCNPRRYSPSEGERQEEEEGEEGEEEEEGGSGGGEAGSGSLGEGELGEEGEEGEDEGEDEGEEGEDEGDEGEEGESLEEEYTEQEGSAEGEESYEGEDEEDYDDEEFEDPGSSSGSPTAAGRGGGWPAPPDPMHVQHVRSAMMIQRAACLDLIGEAAFNELYTLLRNNQVNEASMTDLSRLVFKIIPYDKSEVIQMVYKLLYNESQLAALTEGHSL